MSVDDIVVAAMPGKPGTQGKQWTEALLGHVHGRNGHAHFLRCRKNFRIRWGQQHHLVAARKEALRLCENTYFLTAPAQRGFGVQDREFFAVGVHRNTKSGSWRWNHSSSTVNAHRRPAWLLRPAR